MTAATDQGRLLDQGVMGKGDGEVKADVGAREALPAAEVDRPMSSAIDKLTMTVDGLLA